MGTGRREKGKVQVMSESNFPKMGMEAGRLKWMLRSQLLVAYSLGLVVSNLLHAFKGDIEEKPVGPLVATVAVISIGALLWWVATRTANVFAPRK